MDEDEIVESQPGAGDGGENQDEYLDYGDAGLNEGGEDGDEGAGEAGADAGAQETAQAAATPKRAAPSFSMAGMTQAQKDEINELALTGDAVGAFEKYSDFRDQMAAQRGQITDYQAESLEQTAPEFMKQYGRHVRHAITEVNKHQPGSEDAVNVGVANALLQELRESKDIPGTIARFHEAINGKGAAQGAAATTNGEKKVLPASQRATTPTTSTTGRGAAPAAANTRLPSKVQVLMNTYGLTKEEALRSANA